MWDLLNQTQTPPVLYALGKKFSPTPNPTKTQLPDLALKARLA